MRLAVTTQLEPDFAAKPLADVFALVAWARVPEMRYRDFSQDRESARTQSLTKLATSSAGIAYRSQEVKRDASEERPILRSKTGSTTYVPAWISGERAIAERPSAHNARLTAQNILATDIPGGHRFGSLNLPCLEAPPKVAAKTILVYSPRGGVGKTTLVAMLGRAFSLRGLRVCLAECAQHRELACHLPDFSDAGALLGKGELSSALRPRQQEISLTTWNGVSLDALSAGMDRTIVDLDRSSLPSQEDALLVVPLLTDARAVAVVQEMERIADASALYVLNQFEAEMDWQQRVQQAVHHLVGERLSPFAIHREVRFGEALHRGLSLLDCAPECDAARAVVHLAGWIEGMGGPAFETE